MAHGGVRLDTREDRLNDPHVRALMDLVRDLRSRGLDVPNVDPNDGGVNAQVLILLETPGPKAVASRFVSRDNPDPSARNLGRVLDDGSRRTASPASFHRSATKTCRRGVLRAERPTREQPRRPTLARSGVEDVSSRRYGL
jgi:hypothetical protein